MKRSEYLEQKWKYSQMDVDYVCDVLSISSKELLEAFATRFEEFLKEDYVSEEDEERDTSRSPFDEGA